MKNSIVCDIYSEIGWDKCGGVDEEDIQRDIWKIHRTNNHKLKIILASRTAKILPWYSHAAAILCWRKINENASILW